MMIALMIIAGLVLLVFGGDALVKGASALARRMGVSELMIGLTLVGFGTSTPELVTSINAAMIGSPGIAVGNVVGSNIANILLILGTAALIYPIAIQRDAMKRDGFFLMLSALMCLALVYAGFMDRIWGAAFIVFLLGYTYYVYTKEKQTHPDLASAHEEPHSSLIKDIGYAVGGIAVTIAGAKLLVSGSVDLARIAGIDETIIGLTIVAVGTSLPEMVTSVMAALKKKSDIAIGNIVGSNIYNIWFIMGATALVKPIAVPETIIGFDIWVMLAATVALLVLTFAQGKISRIAGGLFLAGYAAYVWALIP
jgi:cation:H+ antiporter